MRIAADQEDPALADPLIEVTLSACEGVDEWLAALRLHPAAMGLRGPEFVSDLDVQAACAGRPQVAGTPVCTEAVARGLL